MEMSVDNLPNNTSTENSSSNFKLTCNLAGRLMFIANDNKISEGVYPVRAYPITAPNEGLSIIGEDGHELAWIASTTDLTDEIRSLIEQELAKREFMPEILSILHVSSFATPSTWLVETNRGQTEMILKAEDHIRRLTHNRLLITDSHGIHFIVRDIEQLNNHSRKLLDRFL